MDCTWIILKVLPSQIISILNREGYFKQSNPSKCQKDFKQQFADGSKQSDAHQNTLKINMWQFYFKQFSLA